MAWSGSGAFSRTNGTNTGTQVWQDDKNDGTKIRADRHDTHDQDLATGINACLAKNGENAATADLDLGNNKYTNAADGTLADDLSTVGQVQAGGLVYAAETGAADAYAIAPSPAISAYAAGQTFRFIAGNASTGASTLAVSGLAAKTIKQNGNTDDIGAGDIAANDIVTVVYDGTVFQMKSSVTITAFAKTILDDADAATARATLGLVIGTNVQAYDANLPTWPATVDATEVGYLNGVTSAIQTQIDGISEGKVVQRVEATPYTTYTSTAVTIPYDDTIPQNTEGAEILTVAITPTSTSNRLVIRALGLFGTSSSAAVTLALFQDSTADALAASTDYFAGAMFPIPLVHEMEAGTTSETTFKLRFGPSAVTGYVNGLSGGRVYGGKAAVRLSVEEIAV
jgi:hypothetical protein